MATPRAQQSQADRIHPEDRQAFEDLLAADPLRAERVGELPVRTHGVWSWVEVAVTDLYAQRGSQGQVCNIRRSERLARLEERERILEAVHSEVLQDLYAARARTRPRAGTRGTLERSPDPRRSLRHRAGHGNPPRGRQAVAPRARAVVNG